MKLLLLLALTGCKPTPAPAPTAFKLQMSGPFIVQLSDEMREVEIMSVTFQGGEK